LFSRGWKPPGLDFTYSLCNQIFELLQIRSTVELLDRFGGTRSEEQDRSHLCRLVVFAGQKRIELNLREVCNGLLLE
jgi:hypothetical protein